MEELKKHKVLVTIAVVVGVIVVIAAIGSSNDTQENSNTAITANTNSTKQTKTPPEPTKENYTFDVPSLIGKNIDQIRSMLGTPKDGSLTEPNEAQSKLRVDEWDNTFE